MSKEMLQNNIGQFLEVDRVIGRDFWAIDNFLIELPRKWQLSFVAFDDDLLVGFLVASEKNASIHIHRLAVRREWQSKGIGEALVRGLIECMRHERLPITLKVDTLNSRAVSFYARLGFSVVQKENDRIEMKRLSQ
ncbi:MAG TPA: GNAT family N-acetyltransferase [Cyclobacteriaceae bacterium]|nr:GNAT family N-acetyltransferase [Cyclobacteriaceae bacterium]HRJ83287.1 GNAT family N-acetyltransferase [Cyclobacteriaceae bacterium]